MTDRVKGDPAQYPLTAGNCPPGYRLSPDLGATSADQRGLDCTLLQKDAPMPDCQPGTRPEAAWRNFMEPGHPVTAWRCRGVVSTEDPSFLNELARDAHRAIGRPTALDITILASILIAMLAGIWTWKRRRLWHQPSQRSIATAIVPVIVGAGAALIGASTSLVKSPLLFGLGAAAIAGAAQITRRHIR